MLGFGRDTLVAIGQNLSDYDSDYARISITRRFNRGVAWDFSAEFRHFDLGDPGARTQSVAARFRVYVGARRRTGCGRFEIATEIGSLVF